MIGRVRRRLKRLIELSATTGASPTQPIITAPVQPGPSQEIVQLQEELAAVKAENDTVYAMLYALAHDNDQPATFATRSTVDAFSHQWANLQEGAFMLSDPWFRENVDDIISRQELQIDRSWFPGKRVLDAGCGGGRWSYGLAKLGCEVTAVDVNASAIAATRNALDSLSAKGTFVHSEIEEVGAKLPAESFDLVWSWGVLHHCKSFNRALAGAAGLVKPGGMLHLYLYGRETVPLADDVQIFKQRMRYNFLPTQEKRTEFLEKMAAGHGLDVHHVHDIYAPLINRRFTVAEIGEMLRPLGFTQFEQTIVHKEIWLRAIKGDATAELASKILPKVAAPYWFERDQA